MGTRNDNMNRSIEEISVKDILLKVNEYARYFWSQKIIFILPFLLFVGFFVYRAVNAPLLFNGEAKFFLEGNDSGGISGLGGLLGQIGGKKTNPYQIIEVAESKLQLSEVLFEKIGADSVYIANRILEVYDLPNTWAQEEEKYRGFSFSHDSIEAFTRLENIVLLRVIRKLINNEEGGALMITTIEEEKGYYSIKTRSSDHDLALYLSEVSYTKLKRYFEDKTRAKLKTTRKILKEKSDSLKVLLDSKTVELANFKDRNRATINYRDQVKESIFTTELQGLHIAYAEVLKSFEVADYKYLDQKNHFMLIDRPIPPLNINFPNWKIEALKGGLLSLILSFGFLFIRKSYKDIMNS